MNEGPCWYVVKVPSVTIDTTLGQRRTITKGRLLPANTRPDQALNLYNRGLTEWWAVSAADLAAA